MDATVGLAIQCVGILLVTLLSFFTMRSVRSVSTQYWTAAWSCLAFALASLLAGFSVSGPTRHLFYTLYFLSEYTFGLMFIAGCRNHVSGHRIARKDARVFAPFVFLAILLTGLSEDFNNLFIVQASIMAALFGFAFFTVRPACRRQPGLGIRVMSAALALLALDFFQYVPLFGSYQAAWGLPIPAGYFKYTSIGDLILEILLGFGTIMVLMEDVRKEVEAANKELTAARDRLEQLARIDPLTEALNRHAFHALFARDHNGEGGCVAVVDIDDLKTINDTYGHAAGDAAIRVVSRAIRTVTRAEDMLFRWGGDEFLVVMFGLTEPLARNRFDSLDTVLSESRIPKVAARIGIRVSCGLCSFTTMAGIQQAIDSADADMYRRKQARKSLTIAGQ